MTIFLGRILYYNTVVLNTNTAKRSIKPREAYLILDTQEGGLLQRGAYYRGGLITEGALLEREAYSKSWMKRIYMIALPVF